MININEKRLRRLAEKHCENYNDDDPAYDVTFPSYRAGYLQAMRDVEAAWPNINKLIQDKWPWEEDEKGSGEESNRSRRQRMYRSGARACEQWLKQTLEDKLSQ